MPFTPFHWGPTSWLGVFFPETLDFPALLIANAVVDGEPLLILIFNWKYPLHGLFHSFVGGSSVAVATGIAFYFLREKMGERMKKMLMRNSSLKKVLQTSFCGVYLHILLDSLLYQNMRPFYPFRSNPFYGFISLKQGYLFCTGSLLSMMLLILFKKVFKKVNQPT